MEKSLDQKLERIRSGQYKPTDFVIADAKDADMGFGAAAPGPVTEAPQQLKTKAEYLTAMRSMVDSRLVDIMLMSSSSAEFWSKMACSMTPQLPLR